jgi:outer membrane lipoprotein carrier protein
MGSDTVVSGQALFAKPNRLRIQKKQPDNQLTVSDGKNLWVYNPAVKQVWSGTWQGWIQAKVIPPGLVPVGGYVADLRKRFNLSLSPSSGDGVTLNAEPKHKDLGYSLEITVSTSTWMPSETVYKSDSAVVKTALSDLEVNPDVKEADFVFKAPSGVDVIPLN